MAHLASPRDSPTIPPRGRPRYAQSPSPPPQQSKKDKRISMLSNRLNDIIATFSEQHQEHYWAQLSAIQCDINLIMRADPHASGPLDDSPDAIAQQVAMARQELNRNRHLSESAEEGFAATGGKVYSKFVEEVNTAMEERDTELTMLMNEYQDGLSELRRTNQYKMRLAQEEHTLLSKTLRERLIQSLTSRKAKLMRDKEQLDIADSSALLLNPNQFSLGNPSSPGGTQNNRKTRHTRLRDNDELGAAVVEGNKRKRKAAFDETENESPGPSLKETGSNPYRDVKARMHFSQFEAPLYSIDRLFTEKDLLLNMSKAHKNTFKHFNKIRAQNGAATTSAPVASDANGEAFVVEGQQETDGAAAAAAGVLGSLEAGDDDIYAPTPSLFFYLPHRASDSNHATRSQRNTGLDILSTAAAGATPFVASITAATSKSNPAAPPVPALDEQFAAQDLELMKGEIENPDMDILRQRCLDKTSVLSLGVGLEGGSNGVRRDAGNGHGPAAAEGLNGLAAVASAVPMTRSGSGGGVAMAKTNSSGGINARRSPMGGVEMTRSTSSRRP